MWDSDAKTTQGIRSMSQMDSEKARARDWFYELRDQICAAFEGLEDRQTTGPHAGLPAGRFERTPTERPGGGGGEMSAGDRPSSPLRAP